MPKCRFRLYAFAVLGACWNLLAQPTLQQVWARHDQFVMAGNSTKPHPVESSCSSTFKGRKGQTVRGWDVGNPKATPILWWAGGPGELATPERNVGLFPDPAKYRHLEIDQPGTGKSDWVPRWRPEDTVEDAVTFLRLRGVQGPVMVAGWSWGSTMALLFAQRHPELVRGVVIGGVWANTPAEVRRYLDVDGTRSWMPGLSEAFKAFTNGHGSACDLHEAIRQGHGGEALALAYGEAESLQAYEGENPRVDAGKLVPNPSNKQVDLATEASEDIRFAYIESEMMCRGQRGEWSLRLSFSNQLSKVPLVVIQGRYDQVCDPEIARRVFQAWPGTQKLLVPFNGGHATFQGPNKDDF